MQSKIESKQNMAVQKLLLPSPDRQTEWLVPMAAGVVVAFCKLNTHSSTLKTSETVSFWNTQLNS